MQRTSILILLVAALSTAFSKAQSPQFDSISKIEFDDLSSFEDKAEYLKAIGKEYHSFDLDKSYQAFQQLHELSVAHSDTANIVWALTNMANQKRDQVDMTGAYKLYFESKVLVEQMGNRFTDYAQTSYIYTQLAHIQTKKLDFDSALIYCQIAIEVSLANQDTGSLANAYAIEGRIYEKSGNYEKAIESFYSVLEIGKLPYILTSTHNDIGAVFFRMKDYQSAIYHIKKGLDISLKKGESERFNIMISYLNLSAPYSALGKHDSSLHYLLKGNDLAKDIKNPSLKDYYSLTIGQNYLELKNYEKAKKYILSLDSVAMRKRDPNFYYGTFSSTKFSLYLALNELDKAERLLGILRNSIDKNRNDMLLDIYPEIIKFYEQKGILDSVISLQKVMLSYKDSLLVSERIEISKSQEFKYKTNLIKAENEILNLKQTEITKENQNKSAQLKIAIVSLILLCGLLLSLWVLFLKFRRQRNQLRESLNRNTVLLKEIHHRIKNNLQMVTSLLDLQANTIDNNEAATILETGMNRVQSISLLHQKLYQNEDFANINFKEFVRQLASQIEDIHSSIQKEITVQMDIADNCLLDIDQAVPLSLILNELITNSYKYAFQNKDEGQIKIKLIQKESNMLQFDYHDNGTGFDEKQVGKMQSLGTRLISILSKQMKGKSNWNNKNGVHYSINFESVVR
ncbi:MAG: hypothetical protein MRY83_01330 [Flavobacteriales bacterium]|nr:hypothetical protein [Flavobacteriales bacterium]